MRRQGYRAGRDVAMVTMLMITAATVRADVVPSAEVRWRGETDRHVFGSGNTSEVQLLRTRVGLSATSDDASVFVQIQDSRVLGGLGTSGTLANDTNLGVHQAYLRVNEVLTPALSLQAGRFEVAYGNQRILGSVGWANTGRAFEGVRLGIVAGESTIDLAHLTLADRGGDRDQNLWLAYTRTPVPGIDVFVLGNVDSERTAVAGAAGDRTLTRFTAGATIIRQAGDAIDYAVNLAYQFGSMNPDADTELDLAAYLVTAEVGMSFEDGPLTRIGAGVDLASGDDDPADDEVGTYVNEFYTGHKFRGHMDQFLGSNLEGLLDVYGTLRAMPREDLSSTSPVTSSRPPRRTRSGQMTSRVRWARRSISVLARRRSTA